MKVLALIVLIVCCSFAQAPPASTQTEDTHISADDVLDVVVFREPDFTRTVRVGSTGLITLPVAGDIKVAGLTTDAAAAKIKAVLEKSLTSPDVTVTVKEFGTQNVSVIGAVRMPGTYPVRGSVLLLNLLAKAGSVMDNADDTIQIIRKSATPPDPALVTVPTVDLMRNGKTDLNLPIYPGDIVNVVPKPAATVVTVVGEVLKPGEIPLKTAKGTTVRQALASAGWFTTQAKRGDARLVRVHTDGKPEEIPLNLNKIMDSSFEDQPMQPNDILYVPSSKPKQGLIKALDAAVSIATSRLVIYGH
jgi:polysaccharide export outer membrane protein